MNREFPGFSLHPSVQVFRCPLEKEVRGVFHDHARLPRLEASACGRSPLALLSARRAAYARAGQQGEQSGGHRSLKTWWRGSMAGPAGEGFPTPPLSPSILQGRGF